MSVENIKRELLCKRIKVKEAESYADQERNAVHELSVKLATAEREWIEAQHVLAEGLDARQMDLLRRLSEDASESASVSRRLKPDN